MAQNRWTKEWLKSLCDCITVIVENRPETDQTPIKFSDYMVYTLRSVELGRTYKCYHVVGPEADFILKHSSPNPDKPEK